MKDSFYIYLLVMALTTYFIRALPFAVFTKKIENRFIRSFLAYVPYAVLSAMTVPAIFYSTNSMLTGTLGFVAALALALLNRSLIEVALGASVVVYITGFLV